MRNRLHRSHSLCHRHTRNESSTIKAATAELKIMRLSFRHLAVISLILVLFLSIWLRPVRASSSLSETRITQLEFKVRSLQTQLNQLQNQPLPPNADAAVSPIDSNPPIDELPLDDQFDNLATLVIEINQRVQRLEDKVSSSTP